jgi:hypothetical protein
MDPASEVSDVSRWPFTMVSGSGGAVSDLFSSFRRVMMLSGSRAIFALLNHW